MKAITLLREPDGTTHLPTGGASDLSTACGWASWGAADAGCVEIEATADRVTCHGCQGTIEDILRAVGSRRIRWRWRAAQEAGEDDHG